MVEQQPTLIGEDGYRACTYFCTLPCTLGERGHLHHAAVLSPVLHVGTETDIYVTERCVTVVARAAQHCILAVYLLWKKYSVPVERQERILALEKLLEVECISNTDGRSMIAVAPCNPVTVFNPCHTGVVFVLRLNHICVAGLEYDGFMFNLPIYTVLAESGKYVHLHSLVVATEYACISILERYDSTVEDAVRCGNSIAVNDRVL